MRWPATCGGGTASDYRIVRADSGPEALEAIREVVLRGEQVAVILADYRMPQMNGIEFLEQAMDLFPHARRALLTAYADTDAAIAAINVVDVDHYLLKPWEPPEEKLYPVDRRAARRLAARRARGRAQDQGRRPPLVRRRPTRSATSWPATWCPTAGTTWTSPTGNGCWPRPAPTADDIPVVITTDGDAAGAARAWPSSPTRSG